MFVLRHYRAGRSVDPIELTVTLYTLLLAMNIKTMIELESIPIKIFSDFDIGSISGMYRTFRSAEKKHRVSRNAIA